ncbi:hypothetical protein NDU88_008244 [Pleurodeles waltl]|uniref:Uncharacterized protein n=1 Tax=Pleurodeles waltl TaxID=8319 RepID=A0AAV7PVN6_PLEWA|nr:hypothetical protein NDU88_008244 [Pleurodeles waltl]
MRLSLAHHGHGDVFIFSTGGFGPFVRTKLDGCGLEVTEMYPFGLPSGTARYKGGRGALLHALLGEALANGQRGKSGGCPKCHGMDKGQSLFFPRWQSFLSQKIEDIHSVVLTTIGGI